MIKSFIMFDCLLRVIGKAMNTPVCESQESWGWESWWLYSDRSVEDRIRADIGLLLGSSRTLLTPTFLIPMQEFPVPSTWHWTVVCRLILPFLSMFPDPITRGFSLVMVFLTKFPKCHYGCNCLGRTFRPWV
jgi:hypothetical protein